MFVRLVIVLGLVVAMFAPRGPVDLVDDPQACSALADVDAVIATDVPAPVFASTVRLLVHPSPNVLTSTPDLARVFRPPRAGSLSSV